MSAMRVGLLRDLLRDADAGFQVEIRINGETRPLTDIMILPNREKVLLLDFDPYTNGEQARLRDCKSEGT